VYTELALPLVGPADYPKAPPRLALSVSGRAEYYSEFGTTANPRVGLQWVPSQQVKIRTSWGTSFRAPTLEDLHDTSDNLVGFLSVPDPKAAGGSSIVLVSQGNNPRLREERARTATAGFDLIPDALPGFSASVTYYDIDYDHQVFHPGPSIMGTILSDPKYSPLVIRDPSASQVAALCASPTFFGPVSQCKVIQPIAILDLHLRNLSRTTMSGVDVKLGQLLESAIGEFSFRVDGAYVFYYREAVSDAAPAASLLNTYGNPLSRRIRGTIEWNQRGSRLPGFGAGLAVDNSGAYRDISVVPNRSIRASTVTDVEVHYDTAHGGGNIFANSEIRLNVSNVFNHDPPFVDVEIGYDDANATAVGRVVSLTFRKRF